jgi:hypothetical protein
MKRKTVFATIVRRSRSFSLKAEPINSVVVVPPPAHLGDAAIADRSRLVVERADVRGESR